MIFISYASMDSNIAVKINNELNNIFIETWFAQNNIASGENYAGLITKAIKESVGLILIFSKNTQVSPHVKRELDLAIKYNKKIYPLRIDDSILNDIFEYYLTGVQWINLFDNFEESLNEFLLFISNELGINTKKQEANIVLKNPYSVVYAPENIKKYLLDAINIDKQFYNENLSGVLEVCLDWYNSNNEIYTFILDSNKDKVVGYMNLMLIESELFSEIINGDFYDNKIISDSIITPLIPGIYNLYFCSIGVDINEKNNKTQIFRLLYMAFFEKLNKWADEGYFIQNIVADAVTNDGKCLAESFGLTKLKPTSHGSTLYFSSMIPPEFKPATGNPMEVYKKYKNYYDSTH